MVEQEKKELFPSLNFVWLQRDKHDIVQFGA